MNLAKNLEELCTQAAMVLPPEDSQGGYTLYFDNLFSVRFFIDKAQCVLLSQGFYDEAETENYWDFVKTALQRSYGWRGFATSLALDEHGRLQVQTQFNKTLAYERFFDLTDAHCSFCETLVNDLQKPLTIHPGCHAYITS